MTLSTLPSDDRSQPSSESAQIGLAETSPVHFSDLISSEPLLAALEEVGYETPTPIQAQTIPHLLEGRDVIGQAQTGTGKTAAFALPLLERLDLAKRKPSILVLTPTRELAVQVSEAFSRYAAKLERVRVQAVYGGAAYERQLEALRRGVHVVVGTPGRVMDHIRRGSLDISVLDALVLDEADEMLRMGFIDDVTWILEQTPAERQLVLFSATMPPPIRRIAQEHAREPSEVTIRAKGTAADTIRQRYWVGYGPAKFDALTRILEAENVDGAIVFVRTKTATVELCERLSASGFSCAALNGDIAQNLRERTIERLEKGQIDILIATDVAARGLDVARISHVINYDIPYDAEAYVHRIGRTGRAGRQGEAILFVAPRERYLLRTIERTTKQKLTAMILPSVEAINQKRIAKFKQQISETLANKDLGFYGELLSEFLEENEASPLEVAAALAKIAEGDTPLLLEVRNDPPPPRERERRERRGPGGRERRDFGPSQGMARYRIEVGNAHGVKVGHIVGAIANESGLDGKYIHGIKIFDDHSLVDLPDEMPPHIVQILTRTRVAGRRLQIRKLDGAPESPGRRQKFQRGPKRPRKPKGSIR